jgi:molecular chaperone GrpE
MNETSTLPPSDGPADQEQPGQGAPGAGAGAPSPFAAELAEARQNADQWKDQLLRKAAEFENYKRRTEAEYASLIRNASEGLLLALLPVLDDFDRTLKAARDNTDAAPLLRGVELVRAKLAKVLEAQGCTAFASAGTPFDVNLHDALLSIPRADVPPHTVVEEVEKGYMLNDRVLRHAKVVVSAEQEEGFSGRGEDPGGPASD